MCRTGSTIGTVEVLEFRYAVSGTAQDQSIAWETNMFKSQHRKLFSDIVKILGDGKHRITEFESPHRVELPAVAHGRATHCHLDEFMCFTVGGKGCALGFERHHGYFGTEAWKWLGNPPLENRNNRLKGVCKTLEIDHRRVHHLRYKLLWLAYAVVHEANRLDCNAAALVVRAQPSVRSHFDEFKAFLGAYGRSDELAFATLPSGKLLLLAWVNHNLKALGDC